MQPVETVMRTAPMIPVLMIEDAAHARPVAEALVAGGLRVLEVTLRTAAALDAIAEMKKIPGAIVGAGTVVDIPGLESAIAEQREPNLSFRRALPIISAKLRSPRAFPFCPALQMLAILCAGLIWGLPISNSSRPRRMEGCQP